MGFMAFAVRLVAFIIFIFDRLIKRPKKLKFAVPLSAQSRILDGPDRIRRSASLPAESKLIATIRPEVNTLFTNFQAGCARSGDLPCLGTRRADKYEWETYNQVFDRLRNFGSGLIGRGCAAGQKTFLGIYSKNRPEWVIAEQAANAYSIITVPLYDTLGPEACLFIIRQAGIETIVVDSSKLLNLLPAISGTKLVKLVVSMDEPSAEAKEAYAKAEIPLVTFKTVEEEGKKAPVTFVPPAPDDIATICYTSGTTGDPKGAMLTHGNLIANVSGLYWLLKDQPDIVRLTNDDCLISFLPLAHMFERIMQVRQYGEGARVGFYGGDVLKLTEDMQILRPTIFPCVPRLLNRIYDRIHAGAAQAGGVKKILFDQAVASKTYDLQQGIIRRDTVWDKLVFGKVQKMLGGRVRFMITGAAPISGKVLTFLRIAIGCIFVEGYGQTEATAGTNVTVPGDPAAAHVGPPLPCTEIKLFDVPEMGYESKPGKEQGEVCYRGTNIFKGYLHNKEQTAAALDKDGWLHSGDIGEWLPNGTLKIIDRKKSIFKLAQGEYVAPEKIENLLRHPLIAQLFVYGSTLQAVLVAIVVVEPNELAAWAAKNNKSGDVSALIRDAGVNKHILSELNATGTRGGLQGFEQIRAVHLTATPFTVENGLLTPTFKAKRNVMEKHFKAEIDAMYEVLVKAEKDKTKA